ncbi:hypothetical protein [Streptomyces sp. NPDC047869]|uniref:hypothetical protein n=1 Tax=Streptomyces sp. NPDC047869 TaxID=3154709 RepID=UPI003456B39F
MLANSVRAVAAAAACATIATAAYAATSHSSQGSERTTAQTAPHRAQADAGQHLAQPQRVPPQGLVKGMRLPVEDYMLSNADTAQIEDARSAVESACMQRHGFTFNPPSARDTVPAGYDEANMERRYGLTDATAARTHGYQLPGTADPSQEQAESDAEEKAENRTGAWDEALDEVCIPEANQKIGIINPTDPAGELSAQSFEATKIQVPVTKLLVAWSSCMNRAGHRLRSPLDAAAAFPSAAASRTVSKPSRAEVQTATADVTCKKDSHLVNTWFKAEVAYQTKQIAAHRKQLQQQKDRNTKLLARARAVLATTHIQ